MAKHVGMRLLRPAQSTSKLPRDPNAPKAIPLRRDPGLLPPSTTLYRKPRHPGPRLLKQQIEGHETQNHGQHIYLYNNIRTNQVVYSLTRHLNNAAALAQLPFLGKKTQPSHLRKDLWVPFCLCSFSSHHAGLAAYRKLREFRKLHEFAYPLDIIRDPDNPDSLLPKKKRSKILMNQKANSIADLAAVLFQQEAGVSQWRKERWERVSRRVNAIVKQKGLAGEGKERERERRRLAKVNVVEEYQGVEGVVVRWTDVRDAEFAERWPEAVSHEGMGKSRYTAAVPGIDVIAERKAREEMEAEDARKAVEAREKKENGASEGLVQEVEELPPKRSWRERLFGSKSQTVATV